MHARWPTAREEKKPAQVCAPSLFWASQANHVPSILPPVHCVGALATGPRPSLSSTSVLPAISGRRAALHLASLHRYWNAARGQVGVPY